MKAKDYRQKLIETLVDSADRAFAEHTIVRRGTGHYLVQRPGTSTCSFEAVELAHGGVMVGGDIDYVVFAHFRGPGSPIDWIGKTNDLGYVVEKATIGFGGDSRLVYISDFTLAHLELDDFANDHGLTQEQRQLIEDAKDVLKDDGVEAAERMLADAFPEDVEWLLPLGRLPSPRIIYAWRALWRLSTLLSAKEVRRES